MPSLSTIKNIYKEWPFSVSCEGKSVVQQPDHADLEKPVKKKVIERVTAEYNWKYGILLGALFTWLWTVLQDVASAALLPEVVFFRQGHLPTRHVPLPSCSMGDTVKSPRLAWPERVHITEPIHANELSQSACAQVIQHKVSLGSGTGWGPAFKIQYRNSMCFISHKVRWAHKKLFVFATCQFPQIHFNLQNCHSEKD